MLTFNFIEKPEVIQIALEDKERDIYWNNFQYIISMNPQLIIDNLDTY